MIIIFPSQHERLLPESLTPLPPDAKLFDPGLAEEGAANRFRPELPLPRKELTKRVNAFLGYGEQFANPRDLVSVSAHGVEDFYQDTAAAIRTEIEDYDKDDRAAREEASRLRAQLTLALAWTFEERQLEMGELDESLLETVQRFEEAVGLESPEDEEAGISTMLGSLGDEERTDWRNVLAAMMILSPQEAAFATPDSQAVADLSELEALVVDAQTPEGLPVSRSLRGPGYRLLGMLRPPQGAPGLEAERTIHLLTSEET
jgi:hypothetical protein